MKEFLKVTGALILFIVGSLSFLTLARNFNKQPSVVLTSTQCSPPCWYNIHPGQTATYQAYAVLDQFPGIDKDTILGEYNHNEELIRIFWFFQPPVEDQMGSLNIDKDRVIAINISTINSLKLVNLFDRVGEPEVYWVKIGKRDEGEEFLDLVLLSPTKGYAAEVVIDIPVDASQVEVKAGTPVFRVTYFSPEMYEELLGTRILIDNPLGRNVPLQTWQGYGMIPLPRE